MDGRSARVLDPQSYSSTLLIAEADEVSGQQEMVQVMNWANVISRVHGRPWGVGIIVACRDVLVQIGYKYLCS